ncbi:hypothetical protein [Kibdelosporangium phytohabitans]|uniref:Uncharacterized protein n=1 Tax=Kibdelosporangium phytohabitans TaxID=860235 RepID=A0A0N7F2N4_9PSEU|nr:hypothetical protein [Kibdelosporangium phytohabitans]ALG06319.1 hypothetical protein AOZ06_04725 [Kibdelosporangium phytohabitans]MBE1467446.1 hypothetical protein [Kibdelosporangium phytohabitans]
MARTSAKIRAREVKRRTALERKFTEDAAQRQRDEQETELVTDFLLDIDEQEQAQVALRQVEIRLGRTVEQLVGGLRITYTRASNLLCAPEQELKRLRQLAIDADQPNNAKAREAPVTELPPREAADPSPAQSNTVS